MHGVNFYIDEFFSSDIALEVEESLKLIPPSFQIYSVVTLPDHNYSNFISLSYTKLLHFFASLPLRKRFILSIRSKMGHIHHLKMNIFTVVKFYTHINLIN